LRQRKRTSSQEKEAAAEMSVLFKKVKRGVWRGRATALVSRSLKELRIRIILGPFSFLLKRRETFSLPPAFFVFHEN